MSLFFYLICDSQSVYTCAFIIFSKSKCQFSELYVSVAWFDLLANRMQYVAFHKKEREKKKKWIL